MSMQRAPLFEGRITASRVLGPLMVVMALMLATPAHATRVPVCCSGGPGGSTPIYSADPQFGSTVINYGNVRIGTTLTQVALQLTNVATGQTPQANLDAQISATGQATSNGASITALAPGATSDYLAVGLDTNTAGQISATATVALTSDARYVDNCSGTCTASLGNQNITVDANVFRLATGSAHNVNLGATRVGGTLTGSLPVTNTAPADGLSENLDAAISATTGAATIQSDTVFGIAPQQSSGALRVGLDTGTSGNVSGTATVQFSSDGGGIDGGTRLANGSQVVSVTGQVYTPAVSKVNTLGGLINFGVVHVGSSAPSQAVSVSNVASHDSSSLNDVLIGSIGGASGPFTASGSVGTDTSGGIVAGGTDATDLHVGMNTGAGGLFSGSATFTGQSHDPVLSDVAAPNDGSLTVDLAGQVNNYANAALQLSPGVGTLTRQGTANGVTDYLLNLGTLTQGESVLPNLSFLNDVSASDIAFTDYLMGYFSAGTLDNLSLSGGNWLYNSPSREFRGLAAGQSMDGLGLNVSTLTAGSSIAGTINFNFDGYYVGGQVANYGAYTDGIRLTIEGQVGSVVGPPPPSASEPGSLPLFAIGALALAALEIRRRMRTA